MKKSGSGIIDEKDINNLIEYAESAENDTAPESLKENQTDKPSGGTEPKSIPKSQPHRQARGKKSRGYDADDIVPEKKEKHTRRGAVIGIIIGIIAALVFITADTGIIGNYKKNFSQNFTELFGNLKPEKHEVPKTEETTEIKYKSKIQGNAMVSLEGANNSCFAPYRGGMLCAQMNHMIYMNSSGETVWELDTAVVDPILKVQGNYILLAENGRNKICLYNDNRLVYDIDDPDEIAAAELSENGDVVVVTNKQSYKGGVSVYNKAGAQIFSWSSGSDAVVCADICADTRKVAAALLNTESSVKTLLYMFDIKDTQEGAQIELDDTVVFDLKFNGNTVSVFGDNRLAGVRDSGRLAYDNTFDRQLTHSASDDSGRSLLVFDDGNTQILGMYNKRGTLKESVTVAGIVDFIDIDGSDIIYNVGRDVFFGGMNSGNMIKYTAAMDVKGLFILSDKSFVIIYSNSLEFVGL